MNYTSIADYKTLIHDFVEKNIDVTHFEHEYLRMFKNQQGFLPEPTFEILDRLFGDVDAFCSDPALLGNDNLNEEQLRERCASAYSKLNAIA